ncbi:hypothetical protein [Streptomyces melanogenes]|uniref:hypothetical protein n=1 Tax=Streptomyces melanogenes TaxID=67326 RepID=UPI00167D7AC0|nr:hypothetical protein [Streptomyces melanogenes]GGP95177.1 hypothetical protein GCM10010278_86240 [Streptomyces melanogenes]
MSTQTQGSPAPAAMHAAGRRAGRWCAAVLLTGAAATLSAGPARAGDLNFYYGANNPESPVPVIAPGMTGPVKFGLTNVSGLPTTAAQWTLDVNAPPHTTFADTTVTTIGAGPGPWTCQMYGPYPGGPGSIPVDSGGNELKCTSTSQYTWPGQPTAFQWQANVTVDSNAPYDTTLTGTSGSNTVLDGTADLRAYQDCPAGGPDQWATSYPLYRMTLAVHTPPSPQQT